MKYVLINNKDTKTTSLTSFWFLYCFLWTYFIAFSTVPIVDFEQVIICWEWQFESLYIYVDQFLAQHGYNIVTNQYHSLEKIEKKLKGKCFPKLIIRNKILKKKHMTFAKTNRVSKYTPSVQKLCYLHIT